MSPLPELAIARGDLAVVDADVAALKYAQAFHGADRAIAEALSQTGVKLDDLRPDIGQYRYVETRGSIGARNALFVGVPELWSFGYPEIRSFAAQVLMILGREAPGTRHVAMTIHGPGAGLDEVEACLAQLDGYLDALRAGNVPSNLQRITVVDRSSGRVQRLRQAIDDRLGSASYATRVGSDGTFRLDVDRAPTASTPLGEGNRTDEPSAADSRRKSHVFVAMPFSTHMEDVFYFGVQGPVRAAGFTCERIDHVAFAGSIVDHIQRKIETAAIVIAELTGGNPNVCLEVGYAWGKGRPTILIAKSLDEPFFDVKGHRCLTYEGIRDLERQLTTELRELKWNGVV